MVKTQISSKGQTTIPAFFRKRWKTSKVLWESNPDGSALVRPAPDIMALFGKAHSDKPRDRQEIAKAHRAIADEAMAKKRVI